MLHALYRPGQKVWIVDTHREFEVGQVFPIDGEFYHVEKVDRNGLSPTGVQRVNVYLDKEKPEKVEGVSTPKRRKKHRRNENDADA